MLLWAALALAGSLAGEAAVREAAPDAGLRERQARIRRDNGQYDEALPLAEEALRLRENASDDPVALIGTLNLLGELEWFLGRYDRSRTWHQRALEEAERTLGPAHPTVGTTLANLSLAERGLGNFDGAMALQRRALEVTRAARGEEHPDTLERLQNLANLQVDEGDYPSALELYERVLALTRKHFGESDEVANLLYNIGLTRARMGDLDAARQALENARDFWAARRGAQHPFVATALEKLGDVMTDQGDWAGAEGQLERAVAIREARSSTRPVDLAWTLATLGAVQLRLGKATSAGALAARADSLCAPLKAQAQVAVAGTLTRVGSLQLDLGHTSSASANLGSALAMYERLFGQRHPQTALARARLSASLLRGGRGVEAAKAAAAAEGAWHDHVRRTLRYLADAQALSFAARRPEGRDVLLSIASSPHASALLVHRAFEAVARSRALVLDEMASRRPALATDHSLSSALDGARRRLAHLLFWEADQASQNRSAALATARDALESLERRFASKSADARAHDEPDADAETLRARLPKGAALVSFVRFHQTEPRTPGTGDDANERYIAFVLRHDGPTVIARPLGPAARIDTAIAAWRSEFEDPQAPLDHPAESERRSLARGNDLARLIWDPLKPSLAGVDKVLIVPDGEIALVSFAALPTGPGTYLVETGPTLHYLSSERDLLHAARPPPSAPSMLAMGGPDYDAVSEAREAGAGDETRSAVRASSGPALRSGCEEGPRHFGFLPQAAAEARDVASIWSRSVKAKAPVLLVGQAASETALKRSAAGQQLVHIATHGFFARDDCPQKPGGQRPTPFGNPLLESGLALAGANRGQAATGKEDDGLLTAAEVANLDLAAADWVVLSACGSGLGRIQPGEGVLSLQRSFAVAGAGTVVMSLWSVEDGPTRRWMRALYESHLTKGLSTAEAVRDAHREMLSRLRHEIGAAPPALWAAFVATGTSW
jgi:CHAT domain-containing protein/tetratricopeptide (TPR) repeat protein